jgi:hypothetical protein
MQEAGGHSSGERRDELVVLKNTGVGSFVRLAAAAASLGRLGSQR